MSRSLKKGPYVDLKLLEKVRKLGPSEQPVKTWSRSCTIIPEFVGRTFLVHNGKDFKKVYVTAHMESSLQRGSSGDTPVESRTEGASLQVISGQRVGWSEADKSR